jgi:hypothetical protein
MGMSQKLQFLRRSFISWQWFQTFDAKPNFSESPFSRVYTKNPKMSTYLTYSSTFILVIVLKNVFSAKIQKVRFWG